MTILLSELGGVEPLASRHVNVCIINGRTKEKPAAISSRPSPVVEIEMRLLDRRDGRRPPRMARQAPPHRRRDVLPNRARLAARERAVTSRRRARRNRVSRSRSTFVAVPLQSFGPAPPPAPAARV